MTTKAVKVLSSRLPSPPLLPLLALPDCPTSLPVLIKYTNSMPVFSIENTHTYLCIHLLLVLGYKSFFLAAPLPLWNCVVYLKGQKNKRLWDFFLLLNMYGIVVLHCRNLYLRSGVPDGSIVVG